MKWDVLVVDDELSVQEVTELALSRVTCEGLPICLHFASSVEDAINILQNVPNISVVLLDVVMEGGLSGLDFVTYVRNTLNNHHIRFIIRTGQAGVSSEIQVIQNYDIQGYWNKVDMPVKRLRNVAIAAIRNYISLLRIERRREISDFILRQSRLLQDESLDERMFVELMSNSLISLFQNTRYATPQEAALGQGFFSLALIMNCAPEARMAIAAAHGVCEQSWLGPLDEFPRKESLEAILEMLALNEPIAMTQNDSHIRLLISFSVKGLLETALFVEGPANSIDPSHLMTMATHAQTIFKNKSSYWLTRRSYTESALRLAGIVEARMSGPADAYLVRIYAQVRLIALRAGCSEREAELFAHGASLHDIGKIKLPDAILMKPSALTTAEWQVIKTHPVIGHELLSDPSIPDLQSGATIALEHHERWDGQGYPDGKRGLDISLGARITSIVSVHDRLLNDRPYRSAWERDKVVAYIKDNAGTLFDPGLISEFTAVYDEILDINRRYPNSTS